jgi:transposase
MQPGHVLRREFEDLRHGTLSWFINVDVVRGQVSEPSWGPPRTEEDALAHLQRLVASDQHASKWHLILDNLNIHQSEALVRWMAEREGIAPETLGIKGTRGILQSMESRAAFLHDPTHQVVFHYTPKHASWMNQVEIWLSILVRKLLKRGHFRSLDDLRDQILAFIAYDNRTMVKPITWTYTGLAYSWSLFCPNVLVSNRSLSLLRSAPVYPFSCAVVPPRGMTYCWRIEAEIAERQVR